MSCVQKITPILFLLKNRSSYFEYKEKPNDSPLWCESPFLVYDTYLMTDHAESSFSHLNSILKPLTPARVIFSVFRSSSAIPLRHAVKSGVRCFRLQTHTQQSGLLSSLHTAEPSAYQEQTGDLNCLGWVFPISQVWSGVSVVINKRTFKELHCNVV